MTNTDLIIAILFVIYFLHGWQTGIMRTLIGPLSLAAASLAAMVHYEMYESLLQSLTFLIVVSLALSIGVRLYLFMGRSMDKNFRNSTFVFSRVLGGLFSLVWKGSLTAAFILLLALMPPFFPGGENIQKSLQESKTYALINLHVLNRVAPLQAILAIPEIFQNEENQQDIARMPEFKNLAENPKVKELLEDKELLAQIQEKKVQNILDNPKLKALLDDPDVINALSKLSKRVYEEKLQNQTSP